MIKWLLPIVLLFACSEPKDKDWFKVRYVIDGDTLIIEDGSKKGEKVRLIGINAPESRDYKHRKKEPFGEEASKFMRDLAQHKVVRLEYDVERKDKYQRTLAYVYLKDGRMINALMIKNGMAEVMTIPPNVKYSPKFVLFQQNARSKHLGIWQ